ncbi:MAG: hypothetical protein QG622_2121 [Actinomycetota bacterium]|nr:hypothetical protein [Actinomycetota bacterium]
MSSTPNSTATTPDRPRPGRRRRPRPATRAGIALGTAAALSALVVAGFLPGTARAAGPGGSTVGTSGPAPGAVTAPRPVPDVPSGMPRAIEALAPYVGQVSCEPRAKPGTLALARLLTTTYSGTGYVVEHDCGADPIASEHADGRAFDWIVPARSTDRRTQAEAQASVEAVLTWMLAADSARRPFAVARRLGVMFMVWNDRIWSSHDPAGWRPYSTCRKHPEASADAICNRDRLHVSLSWAGATARTSFWSRTVAAEDYGPCRPKDLNWAPPHRGKNPARCGSHTPVTASSRTDALGTALLRFSGATVGPGDAGPVVRAVQQALTVPPDGTYGPFTADAVAAFQTRRSLPITGTMNADTWRALLIASGARSAVPEKPVVVLTSPATKLARYKKTVLRFGSRGPAVLALQKHLRVTPSGWFGPQTTSAVMAAQKRAKLPATGIVNAVTWRALGA